MKTVKRLFPLLITLCLCLVLLAIPVSAASGSCGSNVKWSLSGGTLTISGTGDMTDYWSSSDVPWYSYADDITKVVIKSGVTSIGGDAFSWLDNLTSVTIPKTVTRIGHGAFSSCDSLRSITIPSSVTQIEYSAFLGSGLRSIVIPEGVTEIEGGTFSLCYDLTSVTLPSTLKTISWDAFEDCTGLKSITLPDGLEAIKETAFEGCTALTSINIPDSVTFIGEEAFKGCTRLTSFRIPAGLQTMEERAFDGCLSLKGFTVSSKNQYYSAGSSGELLSKDATILYQIPCSLTKYTIPATVTTIAPRAFYNCALREIVFPATVKTVENSVELFYGCDDLRSVTLNSAFTTIGYSAFSGCKSLERISIPTSVTSIDYYAFNYCYNLKAVYIPASVTSIGTSAFDDCYKLEFVCYAGTKTKWNKIDIGDYNDYLTDAAIHYNASKTAHTYTAKVTKPKCLTGGYTTYTCSCGDKYVSSETTEPAWHNYKVSKTSGGYVTYACTRCSDSYTEQFPTSTPATSNNKGDQTYSVYGEEVWSYLVQNEDGTFTRVEYTGSQVYVEQYDSGMNFKSHVGLKKELSLFGGYYTDGNYHFLVFGQNNSSENDEKEVLRVVKYDLNWKRLGSASLYGANTVEMFAHGSLRMDSCGDYLYVRTAHKMYTYSDGLNHQANLTISVRISDMVITDDYYTIGDVGFGYVSHSFNQFILVDGDELLAVDHGDAYPRAIVLIKYNAAAGYDEFTDGASYVKVLKIYGSSGQNSTGATVGGFEASNTHYLVAGSSIKQNGSVSTSGQRNIYVTATSKDNFTEAGTSTVWLTSYSSGVSVSTPHLVKINGSKFCVMWTEGGKLCYAFLNGSGKLTSKVYRSSTGSLSDCKPIVANNKILWYVTSGGAPTFYQIDLSNVSSASIACEHTYSVARLSESSSKCACSRCDARYSGSLNLPAGSTATFKNVASSASNYQWYYRTSSDGEWIKCSISGSQTATLKVTASTKNSGYQYRCKYRNSSGSTTYTKPMTLYVLGITSQPATQSVKAGKTASFKVAATGLNKTYQWYYRTSSDGKWIKATAAGNQTATLKVDATCGKSTYQYRCKITDQRGNVVYTKAATLYVLGVKTQPAAQSVKAGNTAAFQVTATGLNKTYQWQYKTATSGWIKCTASGSKTATMKVDATCAKNGYQYRCKITDSKGNVVYTRAVTLTVFGVKTQPTSQTAAKGSNAVFSVTATGSGLSYQWQYKTATSGWIKCAADGNQTAAMTVPATAGKNGYQYRCKITDSKGRIVYTDIVMLTVR